MSVLSSRMNRIKPSATIAISDKAKHMQSMGLNVISLGAGESDFPTPEHVNQAAIRAINLGKTKYTAVSGTADLKSAIVEDISSKYQISDYKRKDICVTNGAKQAIFNTIMAIIQKGDEVIIPAPYWVSYIDIVEFAGGTPVVVDSPTFKLTGSLLKANITEKTKLLILNSPNNPTGLMYSKKELKEISEVLMDNKHIMLMTDDIYENIVFDGLEYKTMIQVEPNLIDRTFIINGVSKGYAMTGWRIGYVASKKSDVIEAVSTIQSQSTSSACSISQEATVTALVGEKSFMKERSSKFQSRRDFMYESISKIKGLSALRPNGAFYICVNCSESIGKITSAGVTIKSDVDYSSALLEEGLVAVVPGSAFGMNNYVRLSYATSEDNLKEAVQRIERFQIQLK